LPAGLLIAAVPNASTTCGGVLVTLASSITLNGGTIPGRRPGQLYGDGECDRPGLR
jgi:hypothetical protein